MSIHASINCMGLSTALAAIRIKQFLIDAKDQAFPLEVVTGRECDRSRLIDSLGLKANAIRFT